MNFFIFFFSVRSAECGGKTVESEERVLKLEDDVLEEDEEVLRKEEEGREERLLTNELTEFRAAHGLYVYGRGRTRRTGHGSCSGHSLQDSYRRCEFPGQVLVDLVKMSVEISDMPGVLPQENQHLLESNVRRVKFPFCQGDLLLFHESVVEPGREVLQLLFVILLLPVKGEEFVGQLLLFHLELRHFKQQFKFRFQSLPFFSLIDLGP